MPSQTVQRVEDNEDEVPEESAEQTGEAIQSDDTTFSSEAVPSTEISQPKAESDDVVGAEEQSGKEPDGHYLCAPYCLLYNSEDGKLIPIAIQLNSSGVIYTQEDSASTFISDWTFAKSQVLSAHLNSHLLLHNMGVAFTLEPVEVSLLHNLPSVHPMYKLLHPYLAPVLEHCHVLRKYVLVDDGPVVKFLGVDTKEAAEVLLQTSAPNPFRTVPEDLKYRNVDDAESLPDYFYRDDALLLWDAILEYTNQIVGLYYSDDEAVTQDAELRSFLAELQTHNKNSSAEIPEVFDGRDQLGEFFACIIYQVCSLF
jgi:hypothetical protein